MFLFALVLGVGAHAIHPQPFIDFDPSVPSGYNELLRRQKLCIPGTSTCVAPSFIYIGGECTASGCPEHNGGPTLVRVSNTTAATYNAPTPLLSDDTALGCNAGDYFEESSATIGAFGTDDIVIEAFYKYGQTPAGTQTFFSSYTSGDNQGIRVSTTTTSVATAGTMTTIFGDGGGTASLVSAASDARRRSWRYSLWLFDRSGSAQEYDSSATAGIVTSISARSAALTAAHKFTLCADVGGSNPWDGDIAYLAIYHSPAWLDTHLHSEVGRFRSRYLMGTFPFVDRYATADITSSSLSGNLTSGVTTTMTKCNTTTGVCQVFGIDNGMSYTGRSAAGIYGATSATPKSGTLGVEHANGYTKMNAGDSFNTGGTTVPEPDFLGDGLIADNTSTTHGAKFTGTLSGSGFFTFSVFAKAGTKTWARIFENIDANTYAFVNLTTCVFGTLGAGVTGTTRTWIEDYGGGWCRFGLTIPSTAPAHVLEWDAANGDNDLAFAGNGAATSIWLWGFQGEQLPVMTTLMIDSGNATGALSLLPSSPMASGVGWAKRGYMEWKVDSLKDVAALALGSSSTMGLVSATGGQSTFVSFINSNSYQLTALYSPDGTCTGTTADGGVNTHIYGLSWDTVRNVMKLYVDGVLDCQDTSITANASEAVRMSIGGRSQLRLRRIKLYNHAVQ